MRQIHYALPADVVPSVLRRGGAVPQEVVVDWPEGYQLVDPSDVMTQDDKDALLAGERVTLTVGTRSIEAWVTP